MNSKNIKRIAVIGVLTALSVVLVMLIHFPLIPVVPFLEYDPADIPIYTSALIYGPTGGLVITLVASLIQGLTVSAGSGLYGIIMHVISTGAFVLTAGLLYRHKSNAKFATALSVLCGIVVSVAVMIPANLLVTPYFMGTTVEFVKSLLPEILLFNLAKQCINGIITAIIFKPLTKTVGKWL